MKIKIQYYPGIESHAVNLKLTLNQLGHQVELITKIDAQDESLHILYTAHLFEPLPRYSIIYQTEQKGSRWFTDRYNKYLKETISVWEFSRWNLELHERDKVFYVPPGLITSHSSSEKIYDVLFYGSMNQRRKKLLNALSNWYDIEVVVGEFGENVLEKVSKAKVVLNLHYYEEISLEVFRVNESLCCGAKVVSEKLGNCYYPTEYDGLVYYGSDVPSLKTAIEQALNGYAKSTDIAFLDNSQYVKNAIECVSL